MRPEESNKKAGRSGPAFFMLLTVMALFMPVEPVSATGASGQDQQDHNGCASAIARGAIHIGGCG
jgi:hypothetical protein